jgi:hypothetical protein
MSFLGRDQIPGKSCSVVAATEVIKDSARQIKNQQMGETVETHATSLLAIQLHPNHVSAATELSQGSKTMDEYTEEFYKYLTQVDLAKTDDQLESRYIGGLRQNIQDPLNLFDPVNVSVAHQRALLLEKTVARGSTGFFGLGTESNMTRYNGPFTPRNTTQSTNPNRIPITIRPPNRSTTMNGPKCFKCGEPGHRIADCRKGEKYGKGLLIDSGNAFDEQGEEEKQEATFDDDGDIEEEFVNEDNGPSLMVRRICLTPRKVEGDDGQRHNLFHSTCTIGGKVCKLIIHG